MRHLALARHEGDAARQLARGHVVPEGRTESLEAFGGETDGRWLGARKRLGMRRWGSDRPREKEEQQTDR
jgi:hypothetical protein